MALNAYLNLTGQKSGKVNGSCTQSGKNRKDSMEVIAVSHAVISPRDPASGLPTGKRMHKPFVVTYELDKSVPIMYNILCTNENISKWELDFWTPQLTRTAGTGQEIQNFTIKLTNANVASIDFRMPNNKHPDLMKFKEYVEIAFTYQKIEWVWTDGGITAMDDWEAPVA